MCHWLCELHTSHTKHWKPGWHIYWRGTLLNGLLRDYYTLPEHTHTDKCTLFGALPPRASTFTFINLTWLPRNGPHSNTARHLLYTYRTYIQNQPESAHTFCVGNALPFSSAWRTLHSRDTQVLVANDNTHTETSRHAPTVERRHPHIIYINSPCSATSVLYKRIPDTDDRLTYIHTHTNWMARTEMRLTCESWTQLYPVYMFVSDYRYFQLL